MKTTIFYFTGTGNSLYVSDILKNKMANTTLVSMASAPPKEEIGGPDHQIGFVFPVYFWRLPRLVDQFIKALNIAPSTYCFGLGTMGSTGFATMEFLRARLKEKNVQLSYSKLVHAPKNYIMMYSPLNQEESKQVLIKTKETVESIAKDLSVQKLDSKKMPKVTLNKLYKNISSLDNAFTVKSSCTSCNTCVKVCPVNNIKLENGKPTWLHHCEHCSACINLCPENSIEYGTKTKTYIQYKNPYIGLSDIIKSNQS